MPRPPMAKVSMSLLPKFELLSAISVGARDELVPSSAGKEPAMRNTAGVDNRGFRHCSVEFELNSKSYTLYCRQDSTGNSRTKPQIKRQFKIAALQTRSPTTPTALPRPWVTYYVRISLSGFLVPPLRSCRHHHSGLLIDWLLTIKKTTGLWTVVITHDASSSRCV